MPQEYKVLRVSQEKPNEWNGPHGTVYYIKTMLEGHTKPVSVGKKDPAALKEGDMVYGTISDSDLPEDSFKSAPKPEFVSVGKKDWVDNSPLIRAQWAIGQAVQWLNPTNGDQDSIEPLAKKFYAMVERVKDSTPSAATISSENSNEDHVATAVARSIDSGEAINLDDIPF